VRLYSDSAGKATDKLTARYRAEIAPSRIVRISRGIADVGIERRAAGFVASDGRYKDFSCEPSPTSLKGGDRAGSKEKPGDGLGYGAE